jgi:hypothetical protein
VLRGALVATLLLMAAGVLYAGDPAPAGCGDPPRDRAAGPPPAGALATPRPGGDGGRERERAAPRQPLPPGTVGVAVSLAEPQALAVVRPGDRVDLLAVPARPGGSSTPELPATLASAALVLATVGDPTGEPGPPPAAVYLALTPQQAGRAVGLQGRVRFAITVRG